MDSDIKRIFGREPEEMVIEIERLEDWQNNMIHRIKNIRPLPDYMLHVIFDDGKNILYDVKDDIQALEGYKDLENITGLFQQAQLDHSRTCVFWNHTQSGL